MVKNIKRTAILKKHSKQADKIANLYRAALYLAKGDKDLALEFLAKADAGEIIDKNDLRTSQKKLFWAEKILDHYHLQRFKFS